MNEQAEQPMTSRPVSSSFAASRLGRVALMMDEEGRAAGHAGMEQVAEICLRRGYDADEDVAMLVRFALFQYANLRGIDVMSLPQSSTN